MIAFPADYPFRAPQIRFINKLFHPEVELDTGKIVSDMIRSRYSPAHSISRIGRGLCDLLLVARKTDCINTTAVLLRLKDGKKYVDTVQEYIFKFA